MNTRYILVLRILKKRCQLNAGFHLIWLHNAIISEHENVKIHRQRSGKFKCYEKRHEKWQRWICFRRRLVFCHGWKCLLETLQVTAVTANNIAT